MTLASLDGCNEKMGGRVTDRGLKDETMKRKRTKIRRILGTCVTRKRERGSKHSTKYSTFA